MGTHSGPGVGVACSGRVEKLWFFLKNEDNLTNEDDHKNEDDL